MTETDNLALLKDDMIAFIEGHGIRHFPALIPEEASRVWWNDPTNLDSWKDFVEMAKTVNAPMILMDEDEMETETLEILLEELQALANQDELVVDMEQAHQLLHHAGKTGHLELAFAHQGFLFVHETVTKWYAQYRHLVETLETMEDVFGEDEDEEDDLG